MQRITAALAAVALGAFALHASAEDPGAPGAGNRQQARAWCKENPEACKEKMAQKRDAWWKKVDTNADGSVSRAEADANAPRLAARFDQVDANQDGQVTEEEMRVAAREAHQRRKGQGVQ